MLSGVLASAAGACGEAGGLDELRDGGFGRGVTQYPRDAGMDGGLNDGAASDLSSLRLRFVHALVNLGPLHVCHDPDGSGPLAATPLRGDGALLGADFRGRSPTLVVPALGGGTLTLQRTPADAGVTDGGLDVPCDEASREATIPLPIRGDWLDPRDPPDDGTLQALGLEKTLAGGSALTLLGSGLALSAPALEARATQARDRALLASPSDPQGAARAAELETRTLEAAYGARGLLQHDPAPGDATHFSLVVLHAAPDVSPADGAPESVGAVRLCITADTRESTVIPKPPAAGIPYRYRVSVGAGFVPGIKYRFRIYAARDFDRENKDCSTVTAVPLAERTTTNKELLAGRAYTLALYGAIAPGSVCAPASNSLVRPGCAHPAAELKAEIALLED